MKLIKSGCAALESSSGCTQKAIWLANRVNEGGARGVDKGRTMALAIASVYHSHRQTGSPVGIKTVLGAFGGGRGELPGKRSINEMLRRVVAVNLEANPGKVAHVRASDLVPPIVAALGLPKLLVPVVREMSDRAFELLPGSFPGTVACACAYIGSHLSGHPVTVASVCRAGAVHSHSLRKCYRLLTPHLPALVPEEWTVEGREREWARLASLIEEEEDNVCKVAALEAFRATEPQRKRKRWQEEDEQERQGGSSDPAMIDTFDPSAIFD